MERDRVLVTTKRTTLDYDLDDMTYGELEEQYRAEELEQIEDNHETHYDTLDIVEQVLEEQDVDYEKVPHTFASPDLFDERDAVISVGGDGTVLGTAKYIEDDTPLLPIKSDNKSSGGLCTVDYDDAGPATQGLVNDRYTEQEWTRVEGDHGVTTDVGLNEVFIGAADISDVAEYTITHNGEKERQKSSGLIVSTGAGSTGWYRNVNRRTAAFDRGADELRHAAWSPMDDSDTYPGLVERLLHRSETLQELLDCDLYDLNNKTVEPGDVFTVTSNMNDDINGIVRYDGDKRDRTYDFSRGKEVEIRIADRPLHVVTDWHC